MVAEALGSAHRRTEVLGTDAPVHARPVVGGSQVVAERVERRAFQFGRRFRRVPYRADLALSAGAVAFGRQCEPDRGYLAFGK